MDITYLGHSSFRLRGKNASLVTDPYDSKMVGLKFPNVSSDIVTVSHNHQDHNQSQLVKEVKKVIDGPGEYEVSGISIIGLATYHDNKKGEERGSNTVYVIEIDGLRVVHLGDLGHKLTEDILEDLGTVDILLIPIGGFYTIDAHEAVELTASIEPSITIPMHYYKDGMNQEAFGKLSKLDNFLREVGLSVETLDKLSIKKEELSEEQKVVVLGLVS